MTFVENGPNGAPEPGATHRIRGAAGPLALRHLRVRLYAMEMDDSPELDRLTDEAAHLSRHERHELMPARARSRAFGARLGRRVGLRRNPGEQELAGLNAAGASRRRRQFPARRPAPARDPPAGWW